MHRIIRPVSTKKLTSYLQKRHKQVQQDLMSGTLDMNIRWKTARQTKTVSSGLALLRKTMGPTGRCMYCVDNHGSDIEHFWPKADYPLKAFQWDNWLACCTECGRFKGNIFPLTATAQPVLIDPSVDDPWDFMDFEPATGNLTARYDLAAQAPDVRGVETVKALHLDKREGLSEAYIRTFRRLSGVIRGGLTGGLVIDTAELIRNLREADDHCLLGWCFSNRGATVAPFSDLKLQHQNVWKVCAAALA